MGRPSKMLAALVARLRLDEREALIEPEKPLTPEEELGGRRSELRNGLTDLQRLFLFGKLSGLNDKDAAIAAGYSVSVAENTKQRIWKPRVRAEFERLKRLGASTGKNSRVSSEQEENRTNDKAHEIKH